jgi:hypothetical protein
MAKPKKTEVDQRLLDSWTPPEAAGEPLGCVGTTFTFEPAFFEEHCLSRFLRLETDPREDGAAYLIEREEKLATARSFVLVDRMHADGSASPRWDVISVRAPGGIFHAKISLLAWHGWVRLIIGSANLTEPGYRKNQEVFGVLDFHDGGTVPLNVLTESLDFLGRILSFCPGSPNEAGPKSRLVTFLRNVRSASSRWTTKALGIWESAQVATVFLGPAEGFDGSVLKRLGQLVRDRGGPAYNACVLSPFFDTPKEGTYPATNELLGALTDRGSREIEYMVVHHETLPDGRIRLRAPRSLIELGKKSALFSVWPITEELSGDFRPLHAKSVWLWNDDWHVYMIGSSNFTSAGLGLSGRASNFEANIAYLFRSGSSIEKWMDQTLPPFKDSLYTFDRVIWEPIDEQQGEDASVDAMLPAGFEEALFEPREDSGALLLRFGKDLPVNWTITFEGLSGNVFSVEEWRSLNSPTQARITWNTKAVPNQLKVIWTDRLQQTQSARWPVNVTDPSQLAPPDQLRNLSLSTLLDILCSGRPLHEAITAASLGNGSNFGQNGEIPPKLDPLRRISSETFLLQRTRRVAKAIAQLMETLNRPVVHRDALTWRLRGPVGPCALAKAIATESSSPGEAAFLLSEIVLVLQRIDTRKISVGISRKEVDGEISKVIEDLKTMISNRLASGEIPQSMSTYIAAAVRET